MGRCPYEKVLCLDFGFNIFSCIFIVKGYEWHEKIFDFFHLFCFSYYLYLEKAKFGTEFEIKYFGF